MVLSFSRVLRIGRVYLGCLLLAGASPGVHAEGDCFEFFESLEQGTSGACAEVIFFGFDGVNATDFSCAATGEGGAAIDMFEAFDSLPSFLNMTEPVFAGLETLVTIDPLDPERATEFSIVHRGRVAMFPLSEQPPAGAADLSRFLSSASEGKLVFQAIKPGAAPGVEVPVELHLEQDFEFFDPADTTVSGELGTFFLIALEELESGELISDLVGSSSFDFHDDIEPDFADPFAPGYDGFVTTDQIGGGSVDVEFRRTLSFDLGLATDLVLNSLSTQSIFADGFAGGESSPWRVDGGNSFTFRVSSPDPEVRFVVKAEAGSSGGVTLPRLRISNQPEDQVRLTWVADVAQSYTILYAGDLSLPRDQWTQVGTVTGQAGIVNRDFPIESERGFYALRVTE